MDRTGEPVVVTTAGRSGTDDRRLRQRRYVMTQALRVTCFVLAVVLPVPLWAKLLLVAGAFVLPWIGVVNANGGRRIERTPRPASLVDHVEPTRIALEPGRDVEG